MSTADRVVRERPEDFLVEEISLFEPDGAGDHVAMWIVKRGLDHHTMVRRVADAFGVHPRCVGWAGMKDRQAVTRQWVTVKTEKTEAPNLQQDDLQAHQITRHARGLKLGHLTGNRFTIRMRGMEPISAPRVLRLLRRLGETGLPNRFMAQRFGRFGTNHLLGRALLRDTPRDLLDAWLGGAGNPEEQGDVERRQAYAAGDFTAARRGWPARWHAEQRALNQLSRGDSPADVVSTIPRSIRQLWTDALQARCFNDVVDRRSEDGTLFSLIDGDVTWSHERFGSQVGCELASPVAAGPLWGRRMRQATGAAHDVEVAALASTGVTVEDVTGTRAAQGGRRPLVVPVVEPSCEGGFDEHGPYVQIGFVLPKGSYATAVERHLIDEL